MKCLVQLAAAGLSLLAVLAAPAVAAAEALPDLKGRTIVFATPADYAPYAFLDEATQTPRGFDIDLVEEAAKRLNAKIAWKTIAWDITLQAVRDGQFDAAADGITISEERRQLVDFSRPYLKPQTRMVVRADETRFTDAQSFAADEKLTVVAPAGTSQYYLALGTFLNNDEKSPRLKTFDNFGTGILALASGDVDLVLTDAVNADIFVKNSGGKLKALDEVLGAEEFGLVFQKESELTAAFDAALNAMEADGFLAGLENKWLVEKK